MELEEFLKILLWIVFGVLIIGGVSLLIGKLM